MAEFMSRILESFRNRSAPKAQEAIKTATSHNSEIDNLIHSNDPEIWASPSTADHFPIPKPPASQNNESLGTTAFNRDQILAARASLKNIPPVRSLSIPDSSELPQQSIDEVTDKVTGWAFKRHSEAPKDLSGAEELPSAGQTSQFRIVEGSINDRGNIVHFNDAVAKIAQRTGNS